MNDKKRIKELETRNYRLVLLLDELRAEVREAESKSELKDDLSFLEKVKYLFKK